MIKNIGDINVFKKRKVTSRLRYPPLVNDLEKNTHGPLRDSLPPADLKRSKHRPPKDGDLSGGRIGAHGLHARADAAADAGRDDGARNAGSPLCS